MKKSPSVLYLRENDALDILKAQALEKNVPIEKWTSQDEMKATFDAKALAGKDSSPQNWLPIRARLVLARMKEKGINTNLGQAKLPAMVPVMGVICIFAYLFGVLTDKVATTGAQINLLSPPFFLLILWNITVYISFIFLNLPFKNKRGFSIRSTLLGVIEKIRIPGLRNKNASRDFFFSSLSLLREKHEAQIARIFHISSVLFLIGLLSSLIVRGVGTHYQVGWESTWLINNEDIIKVIFDSTYGLIPSNIFGLTPIPDATQIASLNFKGAYVEPTDTYTWIIRLILLLLIIIAIPRLLLFFIASIKIKRLEKKTPFTISGSYLNRLINGTNGVSHKENLAFLFSPQPLKSDASKLSILLKEKGYSFDILNEILANPWLSQPISAEELLLIKEANLCVFLVDATSTPEDEVHGKFIEQLKSCNPSQITIVINISNMIARFGKESQKLQSRLALWDEFAGKYSIASTSIEL